MEYSIIANLADGRQLTASGYKSCAAAIANKDERVAHSRAGLSILNSVVIVASDGGMAYFDESGKAYARAQAQVQLWYRSEKVAS